jgi:hypothetical protein
MMPAPVLGRFKFRMVLDLSNTGIVVSNSAQRTDVFVFFFFALYYPV